MFATTSMTSTPTTASVPVMIPTRRLHVCHVSISLDTGGLERILSELAANHSEDRFQLRFVPLKQEGRFAEVIRGLGLDVDRVEGTSPLRRLHALSRYFREHEIDIVHSHNTFPAIHATFAARLAGVPTIVNTRHGQRVGHGWKSRLQFRLAARFMHRIVCVSQDAARLTIEKDGIPADKVVRIWNGIDVSTFAFTGGSLDSLAISVGRLVPEKDFPTLIRGVALARKTIHDLRLKIVGSGPEEERLRSLIRELQASDYIELAGEQKDVPKQLENAGFYVSSSLSEGISLTILEAMSVGLPVIATDVGGNPEIVEEGVTGRLVPPANPERLAAAMIHFCQQKMSWPIMAFHGRERVVTHFDSKQMTAHYETLYQQLHARRLVGVGG